MKRFFFSLFTFIICMGLHAAIPPQIPLYRDARAPIDARVKDLLRRMTIEEKAGQLNQVNGGVFTGPKGNDPGQQAKMQLVREGKIGSFLNVIGARDTRAIQEIAVRESRLGIPLFFGNDVLHGFRTIFPIPLAEAASWDLAGIQRNASIAAKEASSSGIHWTFAPMCDISNDLRWGRITEGAGEDPYYTGLVCAAKVRGLQGNLDDSEHIMACVKHYAAYGAVEAGREYNTVDVSRIMLWNKYLPPFKAAVEAGSASVMNGLTLLDGIPVSGNKYLVTDILQKKWGFKGFLVSDWGSFADMVAHGYAANREDAAQKAIEAGSMIDMESRVLIDYLPKLVREGRVSVRQVDSAVSRVLYYKFKLGLFDDPYRFSNEEREKTSLFTAEHRRQAREAGRRAIVLLKNQNNILPLNKSIKKVALIGYYANSKDDLFDFWISTGDANDAVTIYEGLKKKLGSDVELTFGNGYKEDATTNQEMIDEAVQHAKNADVVLVNVGISSKMAGEDRALANPVVPAGQVALLKALKETGKPIVALLTGRPLILTEIEPLVAAIVQCWILGTETGNAVADVLMGDYNPSGKTVITFPRAVGQIPVYYNHFNTGRPYPADGSDNWYTRYRDIPTEPLYPFGYGLSYTTFRYSNLKLDNAVIKKGENLDVSVTVTNTGKRDGEEVVQLYINDVAASIVRPVKELKGFRKILLRAGESQDVHFSLTGKDLSFYDADGNLQLEPGKFKVFVGGNSKDVLEASFELK